MKQLKIMLDQLKETVSFLRDKIDNEKNFGDNNALSLFVNMWVVAINPNINPKGISKYTKQKVEIKANKIASGTQTKVTSWS